MGILPMIIHGLCSTNILGNSYLKFGNSLENSVNAQGLLQQPWYYSNISSNWYKLTYSNYPLDTAIGYEYSTQHWSTARTIVDIYTQIPIISQTDYSKFIITQNSSNKCTGWGSIQATRTYSNFNLSNTFFLGINNSFISITTTISSINLTNAILWVGTKDDFVGTNDQNLKKKGNLIHGGFIPNTLNNQSSNALMITNGIFICLMKSYATY
jgi:hypothetical protein